MAIAEHDTQHELRPARWFSHTWVTTVDHKRIGILYLLSALGFLVLGGLEALVIRLQLFFAQSELVSPRVFNQFFTMHGTTMVFFVVMPILVGFANYMVPLMIGARDMAFPRLNAFSYWLFLFGGLLLNFSFLAGGAPDIGWFAYAPLTEYAFSRSQATDYWIFGLLISGIGSIGGAVNLVTTILCMRAPGMALSKVPLFVWMMLFTGIEMLIAFPPLTAAQVMLLFDRQLGAMFFDPQQGGSAVLWQHLFWFFGHPEVYIMALPAFGIISEVIPVFSRKVIFGYESVALATVAIAFISFGVWAHHMFAVGMNRTLDAFFSGASFLIAVPTGIKVFNWIATLYGGKLRLDSPMLFSLGFLSMFVIGGLTGIMLAAAPVDWQLTDTYFVVAHFHYVLFGGTLFAIMAGAYYWFPKMTGKLLDERLGRWNFWLLLAGFNLTFGPMHIAGMLGMPRRVYTYTAWRAQQYAYTTGKGWEVRNPTDVGWEIWNQLATLGAFVLAAAFLVFFWNIYRTLRRGPIAGTDPWDAWTLEWATASPPPAYNFETIPTVRSRRPLWDEKHPDDPDWKHE
jgi:cytochrome c oxidase subunit 1